MCIYVYFGSCEQEIPGQMDIIKTLVSSVSETSSGPVSRVCFWWSVSLTVHSIIHQHRVYRTESIDSCHVTKMFSQRDERKRRLHNFILTNKVICSNMTGNLVLIPKA